MSAVPLTNSSSLPVQPREKRFKNIVVCCDGTGNQFGECNSNVVKLYSSLVVNENQAAYYHPGVGTMADPKANDFFKSKWSIVAGLAFAAGFSANVLDAYRYLMETYADGDHVYLFGFSRGAYTARALAGLLHVCGLLCPGNEGHIPYAWRMFTQKVAKHKKKDEHAILPENAFLETYSHKNFTLHFVGVWDTVSSVGWVNTPLRLLDMAVNPLIRCGRHAISIDERRCFYHDNLWGEPEHGQDLVQVWFAGVHSDVGGSYQRDTTGPANIAFRWMLDEAVGAGLVVSDDLVKMVLGEPTLHKYAAAPLYFPPPPKWHSLHHSLTVCWWPLEILPHRFYDKDDAKQRWRIPLGARRRLPEDALIHPSVRERMAGVPGQPAYAPSNIEAKYLQVLTAQPATSADLIGFSRYKRPTVQGSALQQALKVLGRWSVMALFVAAELALVLLLFKGMAVLWHCKLEHWLWAGCGYGLCFVRWIVGWVWVDLGGWLWRLAHGPVCRR